MYALTSLSVLLVCFRGVVSGGSRENIQASFDIVYIYYEAIFQLYCYHIFVTSGHSHATRNGVSSDIIGRVGRRRRARMVVGFTTTYAISAHYH
jgi:hypothetical protein